MFIQLAFGEPVRAMRQGQSGRVDVELTIALAIGDVQIPFDIER